MNSKIIFVGGIHGVGKSTICKVLSSKFNFTHISASELIKWYKVNQRHEKRVKDVAVSQEVLIRELNKVKMPGVNYLLDGHFCLFNTKRVPIVIPHLIFIQINPCAIIVKVNSVDNIAMNLLNRDSINYNYKQLEEMQELEIEHAQRVSRILNIPIFIEKNAVSNSLLNYIKEL